MRKVLTLITLCCLSAAAYGQYTSPRGNYEANKPSGKLFNNDMLNVFFAKKITTAFGGSDDPSMQKFYASLDADENSLSLGANIDTRGGNNLNRLSLLFSGGLKMKAKDKFTTLYEDGEFQEGNVGATLKLTYFFLGTITTRDQDRVDVIANRGLLYAKYDRKAAEHNADYETLSESERNSLTAADFTMQERKDYKALAEEEADYVIENKLYGSARSYWVSLQAYLPFGKNQYMITSDIATVPLNEENFYAFDTSVTFTGMLEFPRFISMYGTLKFNVKNNNNIKVDGLESQPFQTTVAGAGGTTVITDSTDGYETNFTEFITPSINIEPAFFFFNNTVGFSPMLEFNFGKYDKINWKLGIPFSFKDRKGEKAVNFEVQWKEINTFDTSVHYVGISTSFLFGELIK